MTCVQDVFTLIPAAEIRALREESPSNLATLCYKAVEKLVAAAESGCPSQREQQIGTYFHTYSFFPKGFCFNTIVLNETYLLFKKEWCLICISMKFFTIIVHINTYY